MEGSSRPLVVHQCMNRDSGVGGKFRVLPPSAVAVCKEDGQNRA
jgi:hypothetical protein